MPPVVVVVVVACCWLPVAGVVADVVVDVVVDVDVVDVVVVVVVVVLVVVCRDLDWARSIHVPANTACDVLIFRCLWFQSHSQRLEMATG